MKLKRRLKTSFFFVFFFFFVFLFFLSFGPACQALFWFNPNVRLFFGLTFQGQVRRVLFSLTRMWHCNKKVNFFIAYVDFQELENYLKGQGECFGFHKEAWKINNREKRLDVLPQRFHKSSFGLAAQATYKVLSFRFLIS